MALKVEVRDLFGRQVKSLGRVDFPKVLTGNCTVFVEGVNLNPLEPHLNPLKHGLRRTVIVGSVSKEVADEKDQAGTVTIVEGRFPLAHGAEVKEEPIGRSDTKRFSAFPYRVEVKGIEE